MRRFVLCIALAFGLGIPAVAAAEPPTTHEILEQRPSGFWTSNRPSQGGAYRYRLLGLGIAIALTTGLLVARAIRRANAERSRRLG